MKYLVFNSLEEEREVNNRIAQEQGSNGAPSHSRLNSTGKVTQYWFSCLKKGDSEDYALPIPEQLESFLSETEQGYLLTQEEFDDLNWSSIHEWEGP